MSKIDRVDRWATEKVKRGKKKWSETPDGKWIGYKDEGVYYGHLLDIAVSLELIYPSMEIINKYERLEQRYLSMNKIEGKEYYWLYKKLLKGLTKLHYRNRLKVRGNIYVSKEDVLLSLGLLQVLIYPSTLIGYSSKQIYRDLLATFYPLDFRVREAYMKLRISRSTLQRHIVILEKCGYLEQVGGDRKNGYVYNVGERSM